MQELIEYINSKNLNLYKPNANHFVSIAFDTIEELDSFINDMRQFNVRISQNINLTKARFMNMTTNAGETKIFLVKVNLTTRTFKRLMTLRIDEKSKLSKIAILNIDNSFINLNFMYHKEITFTSLLI